ncbi:tonsoku-like protein [Macrosteles quadrilineatus]|uniref:tonsoku-like protein n=1 Tax=Macrosteles quadrilineatus TaxID=74068 RepID=UPI0023E30EF1|nr:tonsoku-like protein [Macrosteles quadrilineatus]
MSHQKWEKKKEKAINEGNLEELYAACIELASLQTNKENYEDAIKQYKEAKTAAEAANNTINKAVCHRMIGEVYSKMQKYDEGIKHQHKYLELARVENNTVEEQRALANLGHMYFLKADTFVNPASQEKLKCLEKSEKYSKLSLQTCERITTVNKQELVEMQARLYLNLGLVVEQNDRETAISHYNRAINLCKSMDIWNILCSSYSGLGTLYYNQGDHTRALTNIDKALNVAQRLPDRNQQICEALLLKADILFDLPDFRGAKQCLLKAYKLNTETRSSVEKKLKTVAAVSRYEQKLLDTPDCDLETKKSLYESLGDGCVAMYSYSKAIEYYHRMLATARDLGESGEQLRPCFVSLSQTYKDNKQYDEAIKYLREELELNVNNPVEACKTTLSIAEVLELKEADVNETTECYLKARSLAQTAKDIKLEARTLESFVQFLKEKNMITDSRKMEAELENLKETYGPMNDSSSEEEEENTPDIGADIDINELSDDEPEPGETHRARKRCPTRNLRRNEKGEYPLHVASINGNIALVRKLLDQGHPVNVRDNAGWLPLHEACNLGHLEVVEELLDHGAIINDRGGDQSDGTTPLLDAATCGNLTVIQLLLRRGASPVMRNNKGETVLDCLMAWRRRSKKETKSDLDPETLAQYDDVVKTLRVALKKAGHNPESERRSPSPVTSSFTSQPSTSRGHLENTRDYPSQRQVPSNKRRSFEEDVQSSKHRFSDKDRSRSSSSSLRRSGEELEVPSKKSTTATREYEEAMKSLRRKHTTFPSPQSPPRVEHSALVAEDEVVEDWLVDDLAPSGHRGIKRRRSHHFEGEPQRRPNRLPDSPPPAPRRVYRPISPVDLFTDSSNSGERQVEEDVQQRESVTISDEPDIVQEILTPQQPQSNVRPVSLATQVPLTGFGVVRQSMPPPTELPAAMPMNFQPPTQQPTQCTQNTQQMGLPSIKVRVEGKLLLIPLPTQENTQEVQTIAWLAEEAAKRYYSFEGQEPRLSLQTWEGAMLSPQDPVSLLLGCNEVVGVVNSWKVHKATERYREVCAEIGVEVDDHLQRCLEGIPLSLADCGLDAVTVDPVFRALITQTNLQYLVLCDNRLGDDGFQLLGKLVPKLPVLQELDVSCNGITGDGLTMFVDQVVEHQACQRLKVLKLSHNRLGRTCTGPLSRLLQVTRCLMGLSITSVGLTAGSFAGTNQLNMERIEVLEASSNSLGNDGVRALLGGLSVERVVELHLAHTGERVVSEVANWLARGDPCRLQTLNLAHCPDQQTALERLTQ